MQLAPQQLATPTTLDVVICAYTLQRWDALVGAVASLQRQELAAISIVVVIDHNDELLARAQAELSGVLVVANANARGLSGARNTGTSLCSAEVVAFLDDDATAMPQWTARLLDAYAYGPTVVGSGGSAVPSWPASSMSTPTTTSNPTTGTPAGPSWFPAEFHWVVGCSYLGQPASRGVVRNPIGASMSFRRDLLESAGGFAEGMGRVGTMPLGCEETELAIRLRTRHPGAVVVLEPTAVVHHAVTSERIRLSYFLRRCRAEGTSKALLAMMSDPGSALETERAYVAVTLPRGVLRGLADALHGDLAGLLRAAAIVLGLGATTSGYVAGRIAVRRGRLAVPVVS